MGDEESAIEPRIIALPDKRYANDVLAKTPTKVQWPLILFWSSQRRLRPAVPVPGCALLRPPGAPLPNGKIKEPLRRPSSHQPVLRSDAIESGEDDDGPPVGAVGCEPRPLRRERVGRPGVPLTLLPRSRSFFQRGYNLGSTPRLLPDARGVTNPQAKVLEPKWLLSLCLSLSLPLPFAQGQPCSYKPPPHT